MILKKIKKRLLQKPDLRSEKIISHKYNFIYISIPKAASRSMMDIFIWRPVADMDCFEKNEEITKLIKQQVKYKKYFKFTFVRNPWSRVVSCYLNKIKDPSKDVKNQILNFYPDLNISMSFDEFVRFLFYKKDGNDKCSDRHWVSQNKFITSKKGEILVDYIGKIETMEDDMNNICNKIGISNIKPPQLNTRFGWENKNIDINKEDKNYYRRFYNNHTKSMIEERYKKDIELFKYKY